MLKSLSAYFLMAAAFATAVPTSGEGPDIDNRDVEARIVKKTITAANFDSLPATSWPTGRLASTRDLNGKASCQDPVFGLLPFSKPNVAVYGFSTPLLSDAPVLTSQYTGSEVSALSFTSSYFGCLATGVLQSDCTVSVSGYSSANKLLATQKFNFARGKALKAPLVKATLRPAFKALSYVTFTTSYKGIVGTTALDNVKYTFTTS